MFPSKPVSAHIAGHKDNPKRFEKIYAPRLDKTNKHQSKRRPQGCPSKAVPAVGSSYAAVHGHDQRKREEVGESPSEAMTQGSLRLRPGQIQRHNSKSSDDAANKGNDIQILRLRDRLWLSGLWQGQPEAGKRKCAQYQREVIDSVNGDCQLR